MVHSLRWVLTMLLGGSLAFAVLACRPDSREGDGTAEGGQERTTALDRAAPMKDGTPSTTEQPTGHEWSFDAAAPGEIPEGWALGESNGAGTPATWATVARDDAPSTPGAFGVTASTNYGHTFNVALAEGAMYQDLDMTVSVLAVAGEEDQGGGPVWRAVDAENYYIARWNPLEKNFRVYFVKEGRRKQLASASAKDDLSTWHTIRVVTRGAHIDCYFDGEVLLSVDDDTFPEAGMVGLWTKADAAALFDDLHVEPETP